VTMPPEIGKAVIGVTKQVKQLGKDQDNKFARFKYVSIDKFYAVIGQLMATEGLFLIADETSISTERREVTSDQGQTKTAMWITATYELMLFHESGAEYGPIHRTIMVAATGPQAFGSGLSYVEKYFLRSLFKVPTGEDDAEADSQDGLPETRSRAAPKAAIAPRPVPPPHDPVTGEILPPHAISVETVGDGYDWVQWGRSLIAEFQRSKDIETLNAWYTKNGKLLDECEGASPRAYRSIMGSLTAERLRIVPPEPEMMSEADVSAVLQS